MTLRDAATYITKLPKAEQDLQIWQLAVAHLIRAANRRQLDLAGEHRRTEGAAPRPGTRVQPRSQRDALGQAEAGAGSVTVPNAPRAKPFSRPCEVIRKRSGHNVAQFLEGRLRQ
jgi:hypothetical protein